MKSTTYKNQEKKYNKILSHNNSYGNYAGKYLSECLPNLYGALYYISETWHYEGSVYGVFEKGTADYQSGHTPAHVDGTGSGSVSFNASKYSSIYRTSCSAVRPKSFVVYMWIRIS